MKKTKGVTTKTGALVSMGMLTLVLAGCSFYNPLFGGPKSGGTVVGTSGPEPRWVKNYLAKRPAGKNAFIGEGWNFDDADIAVSKACDQASKRAGVIWEIAMYGKKAPATMHSWTERTRGVLGGERYHAFCKVVKK